MIIVKCQRFITSVIYTISHKNVDHFYVCDKFGKYGPILLFFSVLHTQMNCNTR